MKVIYEHKNKMTFIGFHTEIAPDEGYKKCPEFWDEEYAAKYGATLVCIAATGTVIKEITNICRSANTVKGEIL